LRSCQSPSRYKLRPPNDVFFQFFFPQIFFRFVFYDCSVRIREVCLSKAVHKYDSWIVCFGSRRWPTHEVCNLYFLLCTIIYRYYILYNSIIILLLRVLALFVTFIVCRIVFYRLRRRNMVRMSLFLYINVLIVIKYSF
jgi:hypothetical protein